MKERVGDEKLIIGLISVAVRGINDHIKFYSQMLMIMVSRPPKSTSLRGSASFDVLCVKIGARVSAVALLRHLPPPKKVAESLCAEGREITHAQNRNP